MSAKPVQISLDEVFLRRVDADPEVKRRGRSAVVREALELYLRARERRRIDRDIRSAYGGRSNAMVTEIEDLLGSQEWPDE
jgi:metal-responsive CopG/Arc/MetJ family transcriptional regulator